MLCSCTETALSSTSACHPSMATEVKESLECVIKHCFSCGCFKQHSTKTTTAPDFCIKSGPFQLITAKKYGTLRQEETVWWSCETINYCLHFYMMFRGQIIVFLCIIHIRLGVPKLLHARTHLERENQKQEIGKHPHLSINIYICTI